MSVLSLPQNHPLIPAKWLVPASLLIGLLLWVAGMLWPALIFWPDSAILPFDDIVRAVMTWLKVNLS